MRAALLVAMLCAPLLPGAEAGRILMVVERGFNVQEAWAPWAALTGAGWRIEIAGPRPGTVSAALDGTPSERDLQASIAYAGQRPEDYAAVIVPGGYSPGFLEKDPAAVALVAAAAASGRPLGMICHGPRVLLAAGAARGRVITSLHTVPDELAQSWADGAYGTWIDEAAVTDGWLVTSRSPIDVDAFATALLDRLARSTGVPRPQANARVLVLSETMTRHQRWLWSCLAPLGIQTRAIPAAELAKQLAQGAPAVVAIADLPADPAPVLAAIATSGASVLAAAPIAGQVPGAAVLPDSLPERLRAVALAALARPGPAPAPPAPPSLILAVQAGFPAAAAAAIIADASLGGGVRVVAAEPGAVAGVGGAVLASADQPMPGVPRLELGSDGLRLPPADAALAARIAVAIAAPGPAPDAAVEILVLHDGFDGMAVAAIRARVAPAPLLIVGPAAGPVRGLNGVTLTAHRSLSEVTPHAGQRIWLPGGLWPRKRPDARQAQAVDWIDAQDRRDAACRDWFHGALAAGVRAVSIGFDSHAMGDDPRAAGLAIAASEQVLWSFAKGNGRYDRAPLVQTTPQWTTLRHWHDLAALP
jgi:protease I